METMPFERLRIYQETLEFVKLIYEICKKFPKEETFALIDQLKRATTSILLNIAEGQGRSSLKDRAHFLYISRGSIYEVMAVLDIALSLGFINQEQLTKLREKLFSILKQINSLISYYLK